MREIIYKILVFLGLINEKKEIIREETIYQKRNLMTNYEYKFYQNIKEFEDEADGNPAYKEREEHQTLEYVAALYLKAQNSCQVERQHQLYHRACHIVQ